MNRLRFTLILLRREWLSPSLRLLVMALAIAVAAVTSIAFLADRFERSMQKQAADMQGADLILTSAYPINDRFVKQAVQLSLHSSQGITFPSVIVHSEQMQLVEVMAVDQHYPLRGAVQTLNPDDPQRIIPISVPIPKGEIWADVRLLSQLEIKIGAEIPLGKLTLRLERILSRYNGGMSSLLALAPRVMIPLDEIKTSGLLIDGSRVKHQLMLAGDNSALEEYRNWFSTQIQSEVRLAQGGQGSNALKRALDRGSLFLNLATLATLLIAAVAIAMASHHFVRQQIHTSAILRTLGATSSLLLQTTLFRLLLLALIGTLIGTLGGLLIQYLLADRVVALLNQQLSSPGWWPLLPGLATALTTLIGSALIPQLQLTRVAPIAILQRQLQRPTPQLWLSIGIAFTALSLLILLLTQNLKLALIVIAAAVFTIVLLLLCGWLLTSLLAPLRLQGKTTWRYAIASLLRQPLLSAIQIGGFSLGILALLLVNGIHTDLLQSWRASLDPETPNQFLINIQMDEVKPLNAYLEKQGINPQEIYPMLRAQLTHINSEAVNPASFKNQRARHLLQRTFNLSWTPELPKNNTTVAGEWWLNKDQVARLSIEEGVMRDLGLQMGDWLSFNLGGFVAEGEIAHIRRVRWDSMQPNFFIIASPDLLAEAAATYITSIHLPTGSEDSLSGLVGYFPSVTVIDISAILHQIAQIIEQGGYALGVTFWMTLLAGILVIYAAIQANRPLRMQEVAILRTLGLTRNALIRMIALEYLILGLLAGLFATLSASIAIWFLATELFNLPYQTDLSQLLLTPLFSGVTLSLLGVAGSYTLIRNTTLANLQGY